ncbi:MAG: PAS domain S-box protein [Paracoccus sp. (in: a-proteobacteria)]|uniref:sensor histidine kinase n=1 Tax=Paracoccus sp. TaxID=267 RepID=UPI0026DEEA1D|nr:ATP-binding protein [Paracoccus sp. (in: a-proteobacteria)]MDO5632745.1 PAS domain S-box protein [Paracoccus sp. (in: a-proteobacteria)]
MTRSRHPSAPDPWSADTAASGRGRTDLLPLVPLVAIVALALLVWATVWVMGRAEAERLRNQLAIDALWVEQTLRFQMAVDEDLLVRLATDQARGAAPATLADRARIHIAANPEVLSLIWYDPDGAVTQAVPGRSAPSDPALAALLLGRQVAASRPVYGDVTDGRVSFALRPAEGAGVLVATVSLPIMLERHVPWWIAERYAVQLTDGGTVLAERTRRAVAEGAPSHGISFDPPLRGTVLRIATYEPPPRFGSELLIGAVAALTLLAILALAALYRSVRRRRQAEMRLRGEVAFRRSMEDSLTVGLRAKDHDGRILYVNAAFCNLVGLPAADLAGRVPPMPYWTDEGMADTLARQQQLTPGSTVIQSFETRFRRPDGTRIDVQVFEAPLIDAMGRHRGWMGSVIDITAAKAAARLARAHDESLDRTSRLVTLGEMASSLAHELNQPLAAIASYAAGGLNLLDQGKADPALIRQAMDKISHQARRAGLVIRRIHDFVKRREPEFTTLELDEVIAEAVGFLTPAARDMRVRVETLLAPTPAVRGDRILIGQLLINLIRNAIESMAETRSGNVLSLGLRPGPDGGAVIEIADQGSGIPEALAGQLFDAFTSTKPQGMGIGLNICRSIVELHRGQLSHAPRPGGGTVFTVALPAAPAGEAAA